MIINNIINSDTLSYGMFRGLNNKFKRQFLHNTSYPCPGNIYDSNKVIRLFNRYKNKSRKAIRLYWRYHNKI